MIDEKKLIERLEEKAIKTLGINRSQFAMDKGEYSSYCSLSLDEVKEIVKDLASEHNNGWILCEERLPEETEQHSTKYDPFTLAEVDVEWHMVSDLVNVIAKNYDTDEVFVCDDCTVDGKWANFGSSPFEVLAWQPMPEIPAPYKKGE